MNTNYTKDRFTAEFKGFVTETQNIVKNYNLSSDAIDWFTNNFHYNAPGGNLTRGLVVVESYCILKSTSIDKVPSQEFKKIALLGWAIEMLQASIFVTRGLNIDKSKHGHHSWYLREGASTMAMNDALLLESATYMLLKRHFRQEPYYADLLDLFHEVTFQTELGQMLDIVTADDSHVDLSSLSQELFSAISALKTTYYSFYFPIVLAMYMCGVSSEAARKQVRDVIIPLGEMHQIQRDYSNCFDEFSNGKTSGSDIKHSRCTWLVVQALSRSNKAQRRVLNENYGRKGDVFEQRVKDLFIELKLPKIYEQYTAVMAATIRTQITHTDESCGLKREILSSLMNKVNHPWVSAFSSGECREPAMGIQRAALVTSE